MMPKAKPLALAGGDIPRDISAVSLKNRSLTNDASLLRIAGGEGTRVSRDRYPLSGRPSRSRALLRQAQTAPRLIPRLAVHCLDLLRRECHAPPAVAGYRHQSLARHEALRRQVPGPTENRVSSAKTGSVYVPDQVALPGATPPLPRLFEERVWARRAACAPAQAVAIAAVLRPQQRLSALPCLSPAPLAYSASGRSVALPSLAPQTAPAQARRPVVPHPVQRPPRQP